MTIRTQLPNVPDAERNPLVDRLLVQVEQLIQANIRQAELIQQLRDEIAVLGGAKVKSKFKASGRERNSDQSSGPDPKGCGKSGGNTPDKRPCSAIRPN